MSQMVRCEKHSFWHPHIFSCPYCAKESSEVERLRALLRECLPAISGHLRDKVMQQLGSE
jgi:hypothetical protein